MTRKILLHYPDVQETENTEVNEIENSTKLSSDLEISVRGDNTSLNKCVTNDWPAPLLMDVLQTISTKVSGYYKPPKSIET
jgi:hypothetical protein